MHLLLAAIVAVIAIWLVCLARVASFVALMTGTALVFATLALWYYCRIGRGILESKR
jgi:hypothetical protein